MRNVDPAEVVWNLVQRDDVAGLWNLFLQVPDWRSRAFVMVGFEQVYRPHGMEGSTRELLKVSLNGVVAFCKAESSSDPIAWTASTPRRGSYGS